MSELMMKYFVLNPTKHDAYGLASRMAILEYARVIEQEDEKLADELRGWVARLEGG